MRTVRLVLTIMQYNQQRAATAPMPQHAGVVSVSHGSVIISMFFPATH